MIDIWGLDDEAAGERTAGPGAAPPALMGPPELGLDQADVDVMMAPDVPAESEAAPSAAAFNGHRGAAASEPPGLAGKPQPEPARQAHTPEAIPADALDDPFRPVLALSPEEKIALFS
jgi:hypothetical protein